MFFNIYHHAFHLRQQKKQDILKFFYQHFDINKNITIFAADIKVHPNVRPWLNLTFKYKGTLLDE